MKQLKQAVKWVNILIVLATLLAYISPYVNPNWFWPIGVLGNGIFWLLVLNGCFILFWLSRRSGYLIYSTIALLMGWNIIGQIARLPLSEAPQQEEGLFPLKVMSYNLQYSMTIRDQDQDRAKQKQQPFLEALQGEQPAILCTQETFTPHVDAIKKVLQVEHLYHTPYNGVVLFSKYPIQKKGKIDFQSASKTNGCIWVDLDVQGQTVRVYNVHLQSNHITSDANKVIEEGDLQEEETWSELKNIVFKVKDAAQIRAQQAEIIAAHIKRCPHPIILCGDFNDTVLSYAYKTISHRLVDTFEKSPGGLGTTFAGNVPALRIDYILSSPTIQVISQRVPNFNFSDHYPVISVLGFPYNKQG